MRKVIVFILANLLILDIFTSSAPGISKADLVEELNILFLKENYTDLTNNAEIYLERYRFGRKDKKEMLHLTGLAYLKLGNFAKARSMFIRILEMRGNEFRQDAYIGIADSYFNEGRFDEAIESYEDVLSMYSRNPRISSLYYNLALSYKAKKDFDKANYYFEKVKKQYDKSFEANSVVYLPTEEKLTYYIVQLGVFQNLGNAKHLVKELKGKGHDSYILKTTQDGDIVYKVRGGRFSNEYYAKKLIAKLKKDGFNAKIIVE